MIDFESVFDHISMQDKLHVEKVENELGIDRGSCRILLAEDSNFMRSIMEKVLSNSGYTQFKSFTNGADAWQALQASGSDAPPPFDVIVTDIEMPQNGRAGVDPQYQSHVIPGTPAGLAI